MEKNNDVLIHVFNNGYIISTLLFLAASIGTLCDGIVASRGLGVVELAAVGIVFPYNQTMECVSLIFSSGTQVLVGRKIGRNKFNKVSVAFWTSLISILVFSIIVGLLIFVYAEQVANFCGATYETGTLEPTRQYLRSLVIGLPGYLLCLFMIPLFQLDKKEKLINTTTVVMTIVNVALNVAFVLNGFGILAIGLSTSICYYVALIMLCSHFFEKQKGILLKGKIRFSFKSLLQCIRQGLPSGFRNMTSVVFNIAANNLFAMFCSTEAMAAFSVYKLTKFLFLSVSEAIITPVRMIQSIAYEEKDHVMLRKIFKYSLAKSFGLAFVLSGLLFIFVRPLYSILVTGDVLDETVLFMRCGCVVFIANPIECYYLAYFQVIKKNNIVYTIPFVLDLVPLPLFYFCASYYGSVGIYFCFAIQSTFVDIYIICVALICGHKNKSLIGKLLIVPIQHSKEYKLYDYHIESFDDAGKACSSLNKICVDSFAEKKKAYLCSLAFEEIIFNILQYQQNFNNKYNSVDAHLIKYKTDQLTMRIKDCGREHNPFEKYSYSLYDDDFENLGIKMINEISADVKYSYIFGVNFITIKID